MLNQNTKSFYNKFAENKHDHQSQQVKKESNQTTTQIISQGKLASQNPSIFYFIFTMEIMKQLQCTLLTRVSCTLITISHYPGKTGQ